MQRGKIMPSDVRVSEEDERISIFGIDPVGFCYDGLTVGFGTIAAEDLDEIVAWAYNLGYENGQKGNK